MNNTRTTSTSTNLEQVANHWFGKLLFRALVAMALALGTLWLSQIKETSATIAGQLSELRKEQSEIVQRQAALETRQAVVETRQAIFDSLATTWKKDLDSWREEWREFRMSLRSKEK